MIQPMTVRYARTVDQGNYSNFDIEVTAVVADDETPAQCLVRIQQFVDDAAQERLRGFEPWLADQDLQRLRIYRGEQVPDDSDEQDG